MRAQIPITRVLDALGDPTRRLVFDRIQSGPRSVVDIAATLDVSRPAVSQHLRVLREAGLATVRRRGSRHLYAVDLEGLRVLRGWLDQFWDHALVAFRAAAEVAAREGKD